MQSYLPPNPNLLSDMKAVLELISDPKKAQETLLKIEEASKTFFDKSAEVSVREKSVQEREDALGEKEKKAESQSKEAAELFKKAKETADAAINFRKSVDQHERVSNEKLKEKLEEISIEKEKVSFLLSQAEALRVSAEKQEQQAAALKAEYETKLEKMKALVG